MAPDPIVYLEVGRQKVMVVSQLEWGRAVRTGAKRGITVLTPQLLELEGATRGKHSEWLKAAVKHLGANAVRVPSDFPHGIACDLKRSRIGVEVITTPAFPKRRVKRKDELRHIRQAQRAAVIAMRSACQWIAQSDIDGGGILRIRGKRLTSEAVQRRIDSTLLEHDCFCGETIVACGRQGADPHERGHGPLKASVPIIIDIFPKHLKHGYWGDITRTVIRGKASPEAKRMYAAVKAAQGAALKHIHPGASCMSVHRAAAELLAKRGYETRREKDHAVGFIHGTGHGVGLAIHEEPFFGARHTRLRAGDVVTVEPGLYYPEVGGFRIEDTVVVTEHGWRYLAPCEKTLECG